MADTHRDDDTLEIELPPRFPMGERVASRSVIRNDGTCNGHDIGAVPVQRGEVGAVRAIGTFLQQFYIYAVELTASGPRRGGAGRPPRRSQRADLRGRLRRRRAGLPGSRDRRHAGGRGVDAAPPYRGPQAEGVVSLVVFPIFDRHHHHRFPTWGDNGALWVLTMLLDEFFETLHANTIVRGKTGCSYDTIR